MKKNNQKGSSFVAVLGIIGVLSLILGSASKLIVNHYHAIHQASTWQSSLLAAESGIDIAVRELRKNLDPDQADTIWEDWTTLDHNGVALPNGGRRILIQSLTSNPESGVEIIADAPPALVDRSEKQWWRVRSTGFTRLPGNPQLISNEHDRALRRVDFRANRRTGQLLTAPQTSRTIEVVVRPASFHTAMTAEGLIQMNNHNVIVDSFDSTDPRYSTNGRYDEDKRKETGDVGTNGAIVEAGNAHIYGDVLTNAGTVTNAGNVTGEIRDDYYRPLPVIRPPVWSHIDNSLSAVTSNTTLTGGTKDDPKRYIINRVSLSGGASLDFKADPSAPSGSPSYLEVWIPGDFKSSGNSIIKVDPNVHVTFYVEGDVDITGNGFLNYDQNALNVVVLGVNPPQNETRRFSMAGNAVFVGNLIAPGHDVYLSGSGSNGTFIGAVVGKTVTMRGTANFHYDEALSIDGPIIDYYIASWYEDYK
jgi:hypothetical protein